MSEPKNFHHFRFRAETLVDAVNLRRALYLLEENLLNQSKNEDPFDSKFKMAIVMPYDIPDIEVILSTPYPIDFVIKVMETVVDSHVMIETLKEYEEYTGERTYDANNLDLDTIRNIWSIVDAREDFYFRDLSLDVETLTKSVMPYLEALTAIQKVINDIRGDVFQPPKIRSIKSGSVLISLFPGLGDAITAIDNFLRFRKKRAEADLLEQQAKHENIKLQKTEIEIQKEQFELEVIKNQWTVENDPKLLEAEKQAKLKIIELDYLERQEELRRKQIENSREELKLLKESREAAEEFITPYIPIDTPSEQKIEYILRVMRPLQQIEESKLELHRGRPDILPEFPLSPKEDE